MASLEELIEKKIALKKSNSPKWAILRDKYSDLIFRMLSEGFSIREQVELILEAGIFEKLEHNEYRNIVKKHFTKAPTKRGRPRKGDTTPETIEEATVGASKSFSGVVSPTSSPQKTIKTSSSPKLGSSTAILSQDVDLFSMHLQKKSGA